MVEQHARGAETTLKLLQQVARVEVGRGDVDADKLKGKEGCASWPLP